MPTYEPRSSGFRFEGTLKGNQISFITHLCVLLNLENLDVLTELQYFVSFGLSDNNTFVRVIYFPLVMEQIRPHITEAMNQ